MKYIIHIVLVFLLLNVSVKALSLKEAVNDSLSNNLSLKIEAINVDMAEEDYLQSTTDYFPTITLSGSMSENDYSDIKSQSGSATNGYELSPSSKSIVLSQNVFSGFSRFYSSLSTKEQLHIQNLTQSKATIFLRFLPRDFSTSLQLPGAEPMSKAFSKPSRSLYFSMISINL